MGIWSRSHLVLIMDLADSRLEDPDPAGSETLSVFSEYMNGVRTYLIYIYTSILYL